MPVNAVFLPGSVLPAQLAYGALISELGVGVDSIVKDLEVYATAAPPADYSLDTEVEGVLREVEHRGWNRFHLVGYSGGGAAALAFAARHPGRLLSLALLEPAWAGAWDWSPKHRQLWARYAALGDLPPAEFMARFMRLGVKPEVSLKAPTGDPPPWMATRPAGIRAFLRTFATYDLDRASLAAFDRPVYFALGGLSNPDDYGEIADRLGTLFSDFTLDVFEERHHFDPPHRIEPERLATALRVHWERASSGT